jgi:hypothetical protein
MNKIYLVLYDLKTEKIFKKYFNTEFERDKFKRKLKYSRRLKVLETSSYY